MLAEFVRGPRKVLNGESMKCLRKGGGREQRHRHLYYGEQLGLSERTGKPTGIHEESKKRRGK